MKNVLSKCRYYWSKTFVTLWLMMKTMISATLDPRDLEVYISCNDSAPLLKTSQSIM